jgi:hypothetical protein
VKLNRLRLIAWAVFATLATGLVPLAPHNNPFQAPMAQAQNLGQRSVSGIVLDGDAAPVPGATVFLKNLKTKAIRSYTSAQNGKFRFAQVDMTNDYDLWAEKGEKRSGTKTVSSWDSRPEFQCELKMK